MTTSTSKSDAIFDKLITAYNNESKENTKLNILIYGGSGAGKTYSLKTFKYPLFIDSFDPSGSMCLRDLRDEGNAIVNTSYEKEDADKPTAFTTWERDFKANLLADVFSRVGTYVIDSATTWGSAVLNAVMAKTGRAGGVPQQNDWYPQMVVIEKYLKIMTGLPCDVVLICHDSSTKDDIVGNVVRTPLLTGKSCTRIPLLFSEFYYMSVERTSTGNKYMWQLQRNATNDARSRLMSLAPASEKFNEREPADFRALMKKYHVPYENLPPFRKSSE